MTAGPPAHLRPSGYGGQPSRASWLANRSSLACLVSEGWSGRRGSNPRPTAWKAVTLPLSYSRLRAHALSVRASAGTPAIVISASHPTWLASRNPPSAFALCALADKPRWLANRPSRLPRFGRHAEARPGWLANRSPPPAFALCASADKPRWLANQSSLAIDASEGWWRGKDSNLRSR